MQPRARHRCFWEQRSVMERSQGCIWSKGPSKSTPGLQETKKPDQKQSWRLNNLEFSYTRRCIKQKVKPIAFPYINSVSDVSGFQFEEDWLRAVQPCQNLTVTMQLVAGQDSSLGFFCSHDLERILQQNTWAPFYL